MTILIMEQIFNTFFIEFFFAQRKPLNQIYTVASAPAVKGSVFMWSIFLFLGHVYCPPLPVTHPVPTI